MKTTDDEYNGPTQIGWSSMAGRGTSYSADYDGHNVQVYVTEKRKRVRIWVDGVEYVKPKPDGD